jgi:hypothetical protein
MIIGSQGYFRKVYVDGMGLLHASDFHREHTPVPGIPKFHIMYEMQEVSYYMVGYALTVGASDLAIFTVEIIEHEDPERAEILNNVMIKFYPEHI